MRWFRSGALCGVVALWLFACGGDPEHPPNLPSGTGGNGGGGLVSGSGGSGNTGTGGAPCDPIPGQGKTISGNIIVYDTLLATKTPFVGNATAVIEGAPCGWVEADYFGSVDPPEPFVLEGAKPLAQSWIHFFQHDTGTEDVIPTLQAVVTLQDITALDAFAFVRRSEIDSLYEAIGVERDPKKGTVLVQVVDQYALPITGVIISTVGDAQIAYPSGSSWVLGAGPTDPSGVAALVNATAEPFPGKSIDVHAVSGGQVEDFAAPVQEDAVTILTFLMGF